MNVGEFWGVVILQTLPILGLVPAEFLTCSCFARDSGVAAFLMGEYNLVLKDDKILDILSAKPFFARFGQMKRVIVENLICEMKRHNDTKRDSDCSVDINGSRFSEFYRTDDSAIFAEAVQNNQVVVVDKTGNRKSTKLVFIEDSIAYNTNKVDENNEEIVMAVSKGSLIRRSDNFNWWSSRILKPGENGKIDLHLIPKLKIKLTDVGFSKYLKDNDDPYDFSRLQHTTRKKMRLCKKSASRLKAHMERGTKIRQIPSDKRQEFWASNPNMKQLNCRDHRENSHREKRALMNQLLMLIDLSEIEGVDASSVVGCSVGEIIKKLLEHAKEDDSFVGNNDVKDLMERCSVMISSENEYIDDDNEDFNSNHKTNRSLLHLLKSTTKRSSCDDPTFVSTRRTESRHTLFVKNLNIPRYELFENIVRQYISTKVPLDIESIATMVDRTVRRAGISCIIFRCILILS